MTSPKNWLVTGASGLLGSVIVEELAARGDTIWAQQYEHGYAFDNAVKTVNGDLTDQEWARNLVINASPDAVIHCAALTNVDLCEREPELAERVNAIASGVLAGAARETGARFIHISTDHLWRGDKPMLNEDEPVDPINVYARTKAEAERLVLDANPEALVARTNLFRRGHPWRISFSDWAERNLRSGETFNAFADTYFTPIEARLFAKFAIELAACSARGILHLAGAERLSKYEFVKRLAGRMSLDSSHVKPGCMADAKLGAPRPMEMSLSTAKASALLGRPMPDLNASLDSLLEQASPVA